jgi:hypothetical protein
MVTPRETQQELVPSTDRVAIPHILFGFHRISVYIAAEFWADGDRNPSNTTLLDL